MFKFKVGDVIVSKAGNKFKIITGINQQEKIYDTRVLYKDGPSKIHEWSYTRIYIEMAYNLDKQYKLKKEFNEDLKELLNET